jgi:hypothetical protein
MGGFGLGFQQHIAQSAHLASLTQHIRSADKEHSNTYEQEIKPLITRCLEMSRTYLSDIHLEGIVINNIQDWLQKYLHDVSNNDLQQHLSEKLNDLAYIKLEEDIKKSNANYLKLYQSLKKKESGKFLLSVPYNSTTTLSNKHFIIACRSRLHLPIGDQIPSKVYCTCKGSPRLDSYGDHLIRCNKNNFTNRHEKIIQVLLTIARQSGIPSQKEPRGTISKDSKRLRPDFIVPATIFTDQPTAFDVSIAHTFSVDSPTPFAATRTRENLKNNKYVEACNDAEHTFKPLVFETCGVWSEEVESYICKCSQKAAERLNIPYSVIKHRFTTQLSATLHRCNSDLVCTRADQNYANQTGSLPADILGIQMLNEVVAL